MSKTVQEIMEVMGKTVEASVALERKNGSSYTHIADINPEDINEARYYFDGALYRSVMRCLELKLKNNWTAKAKKGLLLDGFNIKVTHPEGDRVTIGYGGFYIAEEPEYDAAQNLTSIIAYDELYPSMQAYDMSLDWTNGISLKNYLIAILDKLGINYDVQSLNLMANADKVITSEKFLDIENDSTESAYTYRDVLDEIAKAAGVTFAFRNSLRGDEYKLYAIKPTESGYVIDESNLRSVTIGAKYGPVKGVVLSREPQEDNVFYPSNLTDSQTAVKISNVEIMEDSGNDAYRETFIQGIYNNVKNTEYYLYDLDSFGMAFLNFGDIFTIKTANRENGIIGEEKEYKTIFMRTDMTIGNGIKEKSKLEAPQATSTDYSAASTTDKTLKKTMLKVDKQNQKITAYIADTDGKYSLLEQTVEGINLNIEDPEKGLKAQLTATAKEATAAYSKAETVQGQVEGVTTQIQSINDELSGIDDTIAKQVTTEVQKDTTIEILAGKVNSQISGNYVTKTDYDDEKKNWVLLTDYNSRLEQTDQNITASVNRIQTLEDAGYITETQAQSMIDLQEYNITLSVEKNLKIGARNILLDSACFASFTPSGHNTQEVKAFTFPEQSLPSNKYRKVYFKSSLNGISGFIFLNSNIISQADNEITKLKTDVTYTLSFWLKKDSVFNPGNIMKSNIIYVGRNASVEFDNDRCVFPTVSENWQKYVLTFKIKGEIEQFYLRFLFDSCSKYTDSNGITYSAFISSLKLEEGNIATDWTPSETDLVSNATYNSFIELLPQKISLGVTETVTDSYVAEKIHSKCVSVELDTNGFTINNGAFILKDDEGEIMIDSTGIHSEYLNFGKTIDMETIKNGEVIDANDVDIWTLRNYTGSKTGMLNAKAAVSVMSNIPALKTLFWNNSNNWFCHNSSANTVTIANIDSVEETQTYILTFDYIGATTTNGKGLLPQQVVLISDKFIKYEVGVDNLTSGSATVNDKTYQYRCGSLSCSVRGYDLIKLRGGRSNNAVLRINLFSPSVDLSLPNTSTYWYYAMLSPTTDNMAFIGNIKLKTFVGATLNARALLNSNTDYFFDLGTGILSADEIGCKNLRAVSIPTSTATDTLKKVYIDETTGQLYREM